MEIAKKQLQLLIYAGLLQCYANFTLLSSRVFYGK
jgi:hypothetical protein